MWKICNWNWRRSFLYIEILISDIFNGKFNYRKGSLRGGAMWGFLHFFHSEWTLLFKKTISISMGFYHYRETNISTKCNTWVNTRRSVLFFSVLVRNLEDFSLFGLNLYSEHFWCAQWMKTETQFHDDCSVFLILSMIFYSCVQFCCRQKYFFKFWLPSCHFLRHK